MLTFDFLLEIDVFLTPLKPPTKSTVSVEAINSSLYYIHAASPEDYALLEKVRLEKEDEEERLRQDETLTERQGNQLAASPELLERLNHFRRKPVPSSVGSASPITPISPPAASYQWEQGPAFPFPSPRASVDIAGAEQTGLDDQPAFDNSPRGVLGRVDTRDATRNSLQGRRPLPSVPNDGIPFDPMERSPPSKKPNRWSALSGYLNSNLENLKEKYDALQVNRNSLDSRRPQIRPHSAHGAPAYSDAGFPARNQQAQVPFQGAFGSGSGNAGFVITLVRRDPSHGSQWNVATISTPRMDSSAIDIEISTPGYSKFATHNEPLSLASLGANLPLNIRDVASNFRPSQTEANTQPAKNPSKPRKFHRELRVSRQQQQQQPAPPQDSSRSSLDMFSRHSIDSAIGTAAMYGTGNSKLKSGYYSFMSPWNGVCTFSASLNGQSLKCKHMIPGPASSDTPAVTVAELRFNTPFQITTSMMPNLSTSRDGSDGRENSTSSKRHTLTTLLLNPNTYTRPRSRSGASMISNPSRRQSSSSGNDDSEESRPARRSMDRDEDRLDLSLAREYAGGGMRGDEAKLGKLIIEDEGIKMLDLVVAASMAVWWRAYYR